MKHEDIYKEIISKVGLKEDREYNRLFNPKDLYGEALGPLSVRNFKRFIGVLNYLIIEQGNSFDLIVGAGDSGIALTKVVELFYELNNLKCPRILNMPITRFKYGFDLYDNSVLVPEVQKELENLNKLEKILFVDDEIANGTTLKAALDVLFDSVNPGKVPDLLKVYLVAEDQNFKTENFMDKVDIEMYSFAKEIKGLLTVVRYITPWSIQLKIREHFNDNQIGSKSLINLLLDVPIKETKEIEGIKIPKAKFTFKERDLLRKEVPGFEKLQQESKVQVGKWIKEVMSEYKSELKQGRKLPKIIEEVGFDFSWSEEKVWKLDVPVEKMDIRELEWHLSIPFWNTKNGYYDLTPNEVLENPEKYKEEFERIMKANLSYPLDIMFWKNKWLLLDGLHRLVKAKQLGMIAVKVRKIPRSAIPKISKYSSDIKIHRLLPSEWRIYKTIQLEALKADPQSFGSSYEKMSNYSDGKWQERPNNPNGMIFIALDGNRPVGLTGMLIEEKKGEQVAHVWGMYVSPNYRQMGLGVRLMEASINEVKQLKTIKKVSLMVNSEEKPAISLYEKMGFCKIGSTDYILGDGKNHLLNLMEKKL